jgi:hypothetical protein
MNHGTVTGTSMPPTTPSAGHREHSVTDGA